MGLIKRYFVAGLLVLLPLWVTFEAMLFLMGLFDRSLNLLPATYRPEEMLGVEIPGFGIVVSVVMVLVTGMLVTNILGHRLVHWWERFLSKIPLVRSIYTAVKQIAEALFGSGDQTFQKVFLVAYPRPGLWTLAFQTSTSRGEAQVKTGMSQTVNLFIPTTPNPTSGFFIIAPLDEVVELDMSVDDALKMVISGGVVVPPWPQADLAFPAPTASESR